jgi:hypothetical protein
MFFPFIDIEDVIKDEFFLCTFDEMKERLRCRGKFISKVNDSEIVPVNF